MGDEEKERFNTENTETRHRGHGDFAARRGGLVEGRAEFEDAGADGFDGDGEGEAGGFVEEKDYAVEFSIADAAGEGEANGVEEITAADVKFFF